jgi:putative DNA primase/helicase
MQKYGLAEVDDHGELRVGQAYIDAVIEAREVTYLVIVRVLALVAFYLPARIGVATLVGADTSRDWNPPPAPGRVDYSDEPPPYEPIGEVDDVAPPAQLVEDGEELSENPWFTVRGHSRKNIVVFQRESKLIHERGFTDWSEAALTSIAPLQWWQLHFSGEKGLDKKMAVNWLQRRAYAKGFFDPDTIRGRGAWRDDGRFVFHFGDKLWVDGRMMDVTKVSSTYIYEQGRRLRLPATEPMTGAEGRKLYEAFKAFAWKRSSSAVLVAGWVALAMVGGALRWRPHVWITGGAGSGKTTLLNFVDWLLNGTNIFAQGNSTEAGIRQTLKTDSRPVLFDESEQNNDRETQRMDNVLSLIRQSSTESRAQTMKGSQGGESQHFHVRSMFCLGSIQVGLKQQADMERFSVLALKPKREGGPAEDARAARKWAEISAALEAVYADRELPGKLLQRALTLLPTTIENVGVFSKVAAEKFGSQRDGDQYGTLLAGAWSMVSGKVASIEEARQMIDRYDWSEYREASETEESDKALGALLGRCIRVQSQDVSVYELIVRAANQDIDLKDVPVKEANAVLKRNGLRVQFKGGARVEDGELWIGHDQALLEGLMRGTAFAADPVRHFGRLSEAKPSENTQRFVGLPIRYTRIPLSCVIGHGEAQSPPWAVETFDGIDF